MRTRSSATFPSARISEITRADVRPSSSLQITPASMSVPSWRICAFGSLSAIPGPKAKRPLPARVAERGRAPSRGIVTYLNYNLGCPKFHVKSRGGNMLRLNPVDRPAAVTAVVLDAGRLPVPPCPEHFSLREADRRRTPALRTPDGRFPVGCNVIRLRLDQRAAARLPAPLRRLVGDLARVDHRLDRREGIVRRATHRNHDLPLACAWMVAEIRPNPILQRVVHVCPLSRVTRPLGPIRYPPARTGPRRAPAFSGPT